jgi:hypothetical protein
MRKLGINLIPKNSWYDNLRSRFTKDQWDILRKDCYRKAGYICEICTGNGKDQGFNWPVECHEVWDFSKKGVQKLVRLIALCPMCHKCQHPGLAQIQGFYERVLEHYSRVNQISLIESVKDYVKAFKEWEKRNKIEWNLDITNLTL